MIGPRGSIGVFVWDRWTAPVGGGGGGADAFRDTSSWFQMSVIGTRMIVLFLGRLWL